MQIEGRNPVLESLQSKRDFSFLNVEEGIRIDKKIKRILDLAKSKRIRIHRISRKQLDRMSQTGTHQGVIALVRNRPSKSFDELIQLIEQQKEVPFLIYIREALYEQNIGAIIRTAESAGMNGIVLPPKLNVTAEVVRASMGASEHMQIINESLFQVIKKAKKQGIKVVGIERKENANLYSIDLRGPVMFIIGGEDKSLSSEILKQVDDVAAIPMKGKVNSLNMSVAAAIAIYEKVRQEMTKN